MRADYASLATFQLQSTSDQQNFRLYPPISASAPASLAPEQAASWAYPQPEMTQEEMAFTLVTGILGRLYLSGFIDQMTTEQLALVAEAVEAFKHIRHDIRRSVPTWPLGLPSWNDDVIALGLSVDDALYLSIWWRGDDQGPIEVVLEQLLGMDVSVEPVFPLTLNPWGVAWNEATGTLTLQPTSSSPSARTFHVVPIPAVRHDTIPIPQ
jgi:alpha-galactosidase